MNVTVYNKECPICLQGLDKGHLVILECKHAFHYECILDKKGIKIKQCPCCRGTTPTEPSEPETTKTTIIETTGPPWPIVMGPEYFDIDFDS